jgi:hypothetical protein
MSVRSYLKNPIVIADLICDPEEDLLNGIPAQGPE